MRIFLVCFNLFVSKKYLQGILTQRQDQNDASQSNLLKSSSSCSRLCIVVQSLSRVQLLVTSWTAACEAPLSSTISLQKCCQTQCLPKVNRTLMISPLIWPVSTGLACLTISSVAPAPCSYAVRPAPLHPSLSLLAGHGAWVCPPPGC